MCWVRDVPWIVKGPWCWRQRSQRGSLSSSGFAGLSFWDVSRDISFQCNTRICRPEFFYRRSTRTECWEPINFIIARRWRLINGRQVKVTRNNGDRSCFMVLCSYVYIHVSASTISFDWYPNKNTLCNTLKKRLRSFFFWWWIFMADGDKEFDVIFPLCMVMCFSFCYLHIHHNRSINHRPNVRCRRRRRLSNQPQKTDAADFRHSGADVKRTQ